MEEFSLFHYSGAVPKKTASYEAPKLMHSHPDSTSSRTNLTKHLRTSQYNAKEPNTIKQTISSFPSHLNPNSKHLHDTPSSSSPSSSLPLEDNKHGNTSDSVSEKLSSLSPSTNEEQHTHSETDNTAVSNPEELDLELLSVPEEKEEKELKEENKRKDVSDESEEIHIDENNCISASQQNSPHKPLKIS